MAQSACGGTPAGVPEKIMGGGLVTITGGVLRALTHAGCTNRTDTHSAEETISGGIVSLDAVLRESLHALPLAVQVGPYLNTG